MFKTIEEMITVLEMVVYEGMITIMEREDLTEDLTKELDMNLRSSIIHFVEKINNADIVRLVKKRKNTNAKVLLYQILKKGVSEEISLEKYKMYKLWKKSKETEK